MIDGAYASAIPAVWPVTDTLENLCGLDMNRMWTECTFWSESPLALFAEIEAVDETTTKKLIVSTDKIEAVVSDYDCGLQDQGVCNIVQIPLTLEEVELSKKKTGYYYDPECVQCKLLIEKFGSEAFKVKVEADFLESWREQLDIEVLNYVLSQVDPANQITTVAQLEALGVCGCVDSKNFPLFLEALKSQFIQKNLGGDFTIMASPDLSLIVPAMYFASTQNALDMVKGGFGGGMSAKGLEVKYMVTGQQFITSSLLPAKTMLVFAKKPVNFVQTAMRKKVSDAQCSFGMSTIFVKDYGYIVPACEQSRYFVVSADAFCSPCVAVAPTC